MTMPRGDVYRAAMNVIVTRWICCLLFAVAPALAPAAHSAPRGPVDARVLTARLYAGAAPPSWLGDGGGRAREAVRLLRDAPAHGLDPARYDAEGLASRLDAGVDDVAALAIERDLSTAMLQYLADLHFGRLASGYRLPSDDAPAFDPVDHLREALRTGRLPEAVDAASPPIPMVRRGEATLARYRALAAAHPHWPDLPPLPARRIEPGTQYAGMALVRERLRLFGDLDADTSAGASTRRSWRPPCAASRRATGSRKTACRARARWLRWRCPQPAA
jgi:L,D-transpeptidase YcbB